MTSFLMPLIRFSEHLRRVTRQFAAVEAVIEWEQVR